MILARMIRDQIDNHLDPRFFQLEHHLLKLLDSAYARIDVSKVCNIV
jgi:hypothetical protein